LTLDADYSHSIESKNKYNNINNNNDKNTFEADMDQMDNTSNENNVILDEKQENTMGISQNRSRNSHAQMD